MPTETIPPDHAAGPPGYRGSHRRRASGLAILTAGLLVDVVDVATAAVLGSVGLHHVEMRRAAAAVLGSDR